MPLLPVSAQSWSSSKRSSRYASVPLPVTSLSSCAESCRRNVSKRAFVSELTEIELRPEPLLSSSLIRQFLRPSAIASFEVLPAKARTARCAREQDRGGGRARRVGTRSGFGRPFGPGFFGGAVVVAVLNRARNARAGSVAR